MEEIKSLLNKILTCKSYMQSYSNIIQQYLCKTSLRLYQYGRLRFHSRSSLTKDLKIKLVIYLLSLKLSLRPSYSNLGAQMGALNAFGLPTQDCQQMCTSRMGNSPLLTFF